MMRAQVFWRQIVIACPPLISQIVNSFQRIHRRSWLLER
jgi:hypothetical protein